MHAHAHGVCAAVATITVSALISYWIYKRRKQTKLPRSWKKAGKISKIHLYPLKSGKRIDLKSAECAQFGIKQTKLDNDQQIFLQDRSFLIYGEDSKVFKTTRTYPKLILVGVAVHDRTHIVFNAPGMQPIYVKLPNSNDNKSLEIILHVDEPIFSLDCGDEVADWITKYIGDGGNKFRIGYHDGSELHKRDKKNVTHENGRKLKDFPLIRSESMGLYSDLTSLMLVNQATVDDLNIRIATPKITAEHFRGNIIVEHATAYAEDDWTWLKIGDVVFLNVKPCTRCIVTTIDPETAEKHPGGEPIKTLATYRKLRTVKNIDADGDKTLMGINLEVITPGIIHVGDPLYVN